MIIPVSVIINITQSIKDKKEKLKNLKVKNKKTIAGNQALNYFEIKKAIKIKAII